MKISIRRSGGFAGTIGELGNAEVASDSEGAAIVNRLKTHKRPENIGADLYRYEIKVEDGSRQILLLQDNDPPESPDLRELIRIVQQ